MQNVCKVHHIEILYITLYNPNSNSPVERFHSTLAKTLLRLKNTKSNESIETLMNYALLSYNNSIHSATDYIPFQIIRGRLDYRKSFKIDNKITISQYIQDHTENIQTLNKIRTKPRTRHKRN